MLQSFPISQYEIWLLNIVQELLEFRNHTQLLISQQYTCSALSFRLSKWSSVLYYFTLEIARRRDLQTGKWMCVVFEQHEFTGLWAVRVGSAWGYNLKSKNARKLKADASPIVQYECKPRVGLGLCARVISLSSISQDYQSRFGAKNLWTEDSRCELPVIVSNAFSFHSHIGIEGLTQIPIQESTFLHKNLG